MFDANGSMDPLSVDTDCIEIFFYLNCANVRLNPAKFKVHVVKYITLTPQTPTVPFPEGQAVGNPFATWRKWSWTLPYNFSVRQPVGQSWRGLEFANMQNDQKFYLLACATNLDASTGPTLHSTVLTTVLILRN